MHFVQAFILAPAENPALANGKRVHCKFGFCFLLIVGLYFPRSFTRRHVMLLVFSQIAHVFVIWKIVSNLF